MCPKNGGQYNLMCPKNGGQYNSRSIHGVYVCIGYVSGMYREYVERNGMREMKITTMATTGAAINTLPRYEGDGLDSICRRLGENKLLRAEREK